MRQMVYSALFASLMCIGAYIHIPIGPVPIILNNFFVLLAGLVLGAAWGPLSVIIYLLIGAMGFPVFAGGKSGLAHLIGPTGGYLMGFVISAWITGLISHSGLPANKTWRNLLAVLAGAIVVYIPGLLWLHTVTKMSWSKTLAVGCLPFLPGDALKALAAVAVASKISRIIAPTRAQTA